MKSNVMVKVVWYLLKSEAAVHRWPKKSYCDEFHKIHNKADMQESLLQ